MFLFFISISLSSADQKWIQKKEKNQWIQKKDNSINLNKKTEWITLKSKKNDLVFITLLPLAFVIFYTKRLYSK